MAQENNLEPGQTDDSVGPVGGDDDVASESDSPSAVPASAALSKGGLTPGQRLAAKKAQKAVDKREFKEELKRKEDEKRDQEREEANRVFARSPKAEPALPEEVQKVSTEFTDFMQNNRGRILGGVAAFVGAAVIFIVGQRFLFTADADQAKQFGSAFELSQAQVDATDTDGKNDDGDPVFKTREERAAKAVEAYEAAIKIDAKSETAGWASVAIAELKLEQNKAEEAVKFAQGAYDAHKGSALGARALESLAIALEASGKADEAQKRYEELKGLGDENKDLAEYHLGRLKLAAGDKDGAKGLLKPLYDRLSDRGEGAVQSRYLRGEVEIRLAEIDSSLVDKGTSGSDQQFSQEELQRLIEQLRQQQGGGAN